MVLRNNDVLTWLLQTFVWYNNSLFYTIILANRKEHMFVQSYLNQMCIILTYEHVYVLMHLTLDPPSFEYNVLDSFDLI